MTREGQVVPLPPKAFELLLLMAESPRRAFSKQELMAALWPATFVEEANLSFQVAVLRKALGEGGTTWVETVPRHGYRFATEVDRIPAARATSRALTTAPSVGAATTASARKRWVAVTAGALVLAAGWFLFSRARRGETERTAASVAVPLTAYPGFEIAPSLSPDGSQVAFSWDGPGQDNYDIYVKLVGPGPALRLTTDPARDDSPAWSPDGRTIAFHRFTTETTADVFVVPALGGAERRVAAAVPAYSRFGAGRALTGNLAWTPDGQWLAFGGPSPQEDRGIWLIAADGSEKRRLTDSLDWRPSFSSDGRYLAFFRQHQAHLMLNVLPLSSSMTGAGSPSLVTPDTVWGLGLAWMPDGGALMFASSGHLGLSRLQRVSLGPDRLTPLGLPESLPFGEQATGVTVSKTGRLVYSAQFRDSNIRQVSLDGQPRLAAEPLAASTLDDHVPDYSPDGKRLVFSSTRSGVEEIWISDADGSNPGQLTTTGGRQCSNARWSRGGVETKVADGLSYSLNFVVGQRGLYFLAVGDAPHKTSIDFYDFATDRRTTLISVGKQWWYGMALAPDERSLLVSTVDSAGSNLMVVDQLQ